MKHAFLLILIACSLIAPNTSLAAYPQPVNDYVNDFAQVLTAADAQAIEKMLSDLEKQTGIEVVVVTINFMGDYNTGTSSIEEFAKNLFNTWGVGHKKENNGVMILVAVKDRQCRIQLGGGYGKQYDAVMKKVIDQNMLPYFKQDDYSRGIYEGARGVIDNITKEVSWFSYHKYHLLVGLLIVVCIVAGISCMKSGKKGWGWAFFIAAGALLLFLIKALASGKSSSGFGGGSSFGGGASGSW